MSQPTLETIKQRVLPDLQSVDEVIRTRLASDVVLVNQVSEYIIHSGGKRIRPLVTVLAGRACGSDGRHLATAAAIVEFVHTATLLHDDVVDGSELRRGNDTANAVWGNQTSVLVGDYLYSRAFEMMVDLNNMRVMEVMARATNKIAEGEVLQLMNANDPGTTEERYMEVIYRKTAKLFEAGAQIAAIVAGTGHAQEHALTDYGKHLGIAFQLVDDVLDYRASRDELGKNLGDDLAEGKPTLPLIHALKHGNASQQQLIRHAIEHGGIESLNEITAAIESTGGLEYTARRARHEADLAVESLAALPDSGFVQSLRELAMFSVNRGY
ncbi:MAG TPA: octaprenyl diphosphate synthase [Steroidobacteraceae bacterium]|nr:octaprenyl diphosphate synthase [Steroidobacteraceae bacterium]